MANSKHISQDEIQYIVDVESSKAQQEIHKLEKESSKLRSENKQRLNQMIQLEAQGKKNTSAYQALRKEYTDNSKKISELTSKIGELTSKLDVNQMTMKQLKKEARDLRRNLEDTSQATNPQEYAILEGRLKEVTTRMSELRQNAKSLNEVMTENATQGIMMGNVLTKLAEYLGNTAKKVKGFVSSMAEDGIEMARQADGITKAFNELNQPDLLDNLRAATKGTVNDVELMKSAVQANDFRIPLEDLGKYLSFAQLKAQQTGKTVAGRAIGRAGAKAFNRLGLSRIAGELTKISTSKWYTEMGKIARAGGWHGAPGEAIEEYEGWLFDAMTGHGKEAWEEMKNPQSHVDIWLTTAVMSAMLGGAPTVVQGYHSAQYFNHKHKTDRADRMAGFRLGEERWQELRDKIENTDNAHMAGVVVRDVIKNNDLNSAEKQAVLEYVREYVRFRGYNIAEANNTDNSDNVSDATRARNDAYRDGYSAADGAAMGAAKAELLAAQAAFETHVGTVHSAQDILDSYNEEGQPMFNEETRQLAENVIVAQERYEGVLQRVRDTIDDEVSIAGLTVDMRTNEETWQVQRVTLMERDGIRGEHHTAWLTSGFVTTREDGSIDVENSSHSVIVVGEDGKPRMIDPAFIQSVEQPQDAAEARREAMQAAELRLAEEAARMIDENAANSQTETEEQPATEETPATEEEDGGESMLDDVKAEQASAAAEALTGGDGDNGTKTYVPMGAREWKQGDTFMIQGDGGGLVRGEVIGIEDDGNLRIHTDGKRGGKSVSMIRPDELDTMAYTEYVPNTTEETGAQAATPATEESELGTGTQETGTEDAGSDETLLPTEEEEAGQETGDATEETGAQPATEEQGGTEENSADDEQTETALEDMPAAAAYDNVMAQAEGDAEIAQSVIESMVADKRAELNRAEKAKAKGGKTVAEKIAAEKARKAAIEEARASLAAWENIAEEGKARAQAAEEAANADTPQTPEAAERDAQENNKPKTETSTDGSTTEPQGGTEENNKTEPQTETAEPQTEPQTGTPQTETTETTEDAEQNAEQPKTEDKPKGKAKEKADKPKEDKPEQPKGGKKAAEKKGKTAEKKNGRKREERMDGERGSELGRDEVALRDALAERLRGAGVEVITDDVAGQEVLDAADEDVRLMGSRTNKRMQQIGAEMDGRELSPEEKAVADVFSGKADNTKLTVSRDGKPVTIMMRQGNETKAGTKHSVYRHYDTRSNGYTTDEILRIPEFVENGKRSEQGSRVSYEYTDESTHTTYTVTTEMNNRGEETFTNFYTNRKKQNRLSRRPQRPRPKAHKPNNDNASSGAKVSNNSGKNGKTGENLRFFRTESGEAYGFTADGKIYLDPRVATAETPIHEYAHLWADALREANPAEWGNVVELMRGTWAWEHVQRLYPELTSDEAIADEALAHYSGRRGAERARAAMAEAERQGGLLGRAAAISGLERLQKALGKFWKNVCDLVGVRFTTAEDVADRVMADLLNGVKPKGRSEAEVRAERDETARRDADYLQAVERGDMETAQKMVDDAARRAGYEVPDYQGRGSWVAPSAPVERNDFENLDALRESVEEYGGDVSVYGIINGVTKSHDDFYYNPDRAGIGGQAASDTASVLRKLRYDKAKADTKVKVYRAVPNDVRGRKLMAGDWVALSRAYCEEHGDNRYGEGNFHIVEAEVPISQIWNDGNDMREFGFDDGLRDAEKNVPNNRKLLDPVTYDNQGRVIPLSERFNEKNSDIRYQRAGETRQDVEAVNERFNEELQAQIDGRQEAGHVYQLGRPSAILRSTGFPDVPIELSATRLAEKAAQQNHEFEISEARNLVEALQSPIAVFSYGNKMKSQNAIVEIQHKGKNFVVGVHFYQERRGLVVSDIRGLFPKDNAEWLNWISQGKALYINKEKIQNLVDQQRTTLAEVEYLDLDSIAKVVETFENPTEPGKKLSDESENIQESGQNEGLDAAETDEKLSRKGGRTLVGVHNISEDKLRKALRQGGLANPSLAVIDAYRQTHNGYGEISLVAPHSMVDQSSGNNAGTWMGDAWTPTYPTTERRMSEDGSEQASKDINSVPRGMQGKVSAGIDSWLDGRGVNDAMAYLFLHEMGKAPEVQEHETKYGEQVRETIGEIASRNTDFAKMGEEERKAVLDAYVQEKYGGDKAAYEADLKKRIGELDVKLQSESPLIRRRAERSMREYEKYGADVDGLNGFVRDVVLDNKLAGTADAERTTGAARRYVDEHHLQEEMGKWADGVLPQRYGTSEFIFDGFTPQGERRYLPNTLANASAYMNRQGLAGAADVMGDFGAFAAKVMKSYGKLSDIRKNKGRLTENHEDLESFREKWSAVFDELGRKCQPDATSIYEDYGAERLTEAVGKRNPVAYLKSEYGVELSEEDTKKLDGLIRAVREDYPAMYFETKFERPVDFGEFAAAVVPEGTGKDIVDALEAQGLRVVSYDAKIPGARQKAVQQVAEGGDGLLFRGENAETGSAAARASETVAGRRAAMADAARDAAARLGLDNVDIVEDAGTLDGRLRGKKGWYDPRTGRITVVADNHTGAADVVRTLLHEGVAHHGLRGLFGEGFGEFVDGVYENATDDVRAAIDGMAARGGLTRAVATEEYLAGLAERGGFDGAGRGLWERIKNLFRTMLRKAGLKADALTDADLRYTLWRSYENLRNGGSGGVLARAADMAKREELGIGNERETPRNWGRGGVLDKAAMAARGIDAGLLFRDSIEDTDDTARVIYNARAGSAWNAFVEAYQDGMRSVRLLQEAVLAQRDEEVLEDWEDAYNEENRRHSHAQDEREYFDNAMYQPLVKAVNEVAKMAKVSVGEVVEYMMAKSGMERNEVLARRDARADYERYEEKQRAKYDEYVRKGKQAYKEYKARQEAAYKAYERESKLRYKAWEQLARQRYRTYKAEHPNGKKTEADFLGKTIDDFKTKTLADFLTKTEDDFTGKSFQDFLTKTEDDFYDERRKKDYSGLTALTGEADVADAEAEAARIAAEMERRADTAYMWDKVRAATGWTLDKGYEYGLMSRENYKSVKFMMDYYVPMRGFAEDTAGDLYDYVAGSGNSFSPVLHRARGRKSVADDPLAYIASMATSAITAGNQNRVKQSFMDFVENHPTNLVTVSEMWYRNQGTVDNPDWVEAVPYIPEDATPDDVDAIVRQHEADMETLKAQGLATKERGKLRLGVPVKRGEALEHHVEVLRNGKKYVLYVNGNPRAAQALNGTRARRAAKYGNNGALTLWANQLDKKGGKYTNKVLRRIANVLRAAARGNRWLARAYTSLNADFMVGNAFRDTHMALVSTIVKEGLGYGLRYRRNLLVLAGPLRMAGLRKWYEEYRNNGGDGTDLTGTKKMYYEFVTGGGRTGYTALADIEQYKDELADMVRDERRVAVHPNKILHKVMDMVEWLNSSVEDMNRFAVFMASRQIGRSVRRSATDAKNITLNFNRKGNGEYGNQFLRENFVFVNPAIQAIDTMVGMTKQHPWRMSGVMATHVAAGMGAPMLTMLLDSVFGDDDDDWSAIDEYMKLPSWIRANNFVIWIPGTKKFMMLPLTQELRVIYGLGECMFSVLTGYSEENPATEFLTRLSGLLPIDMTGNGGNPAINLAPTALQPLLQVAFNTGHSGNPIYKDSEYNKYDPAAGKAYVGTPELLVKLSAKINELTGGNKHRQGWLEQSKAGGYLNNPAVMNHLLKGYFGGLYSVAASGASTLVKLISGETPDAREIPIARRVVTAPVDTKQNGKMKMPEWYYDFEERKDRYENEFGGFTKDTQKGDKEAGAVIGDMTRSKDFEYWKVVGGLMNAVQDMRNDMDYITDDEARAAVEKQVEATLEQINTLRTQGTKGLETLRKQNEARESEAQDVDDGTSYDYSDEYDEEYEEE